LRSRTLNTAVVAAPLALLAVMLFPGAAFAGQGGLSGGTGACADSGSTIGCAADAGGSTGTGSSGGSGATTTADDGGTTPTPSCPNYVPYPQGGPPPAGENPDGAWYTNTCASGVSQGMGTGVVWIVTNQAPPPPPPPDPAVVAAQAASQLQLATPTLTFSPATTAYVKFPEWLWINAAIWHPVTTSATACNAGGCTTVAATATPDYVTWDTGDGTPATVCDGPGTPYVLSVAYSEQSTGCSHTYEISSVGEPSSDGNPNDAAFPISATVDWTVTWAGPDGSAGQLPAIKTQGTSTVQVQQIESVLK
jgi:hypothetical protein